MKRLDSAGEFAGLTVEQQVNKCRARAAEAKSLADAGPAEKAVPHLDFAAEWSGLANEMERFVHERRMKPADASAMAAFLMGGGQVTKIPEPLLVTAQDVLDFLKTCGVAVTYSANESKSYCCEGRRMKLGNIVALANRKRRAQQLPLFAV